MCSCDNQNYEIISNRDHAIPDDHIYDVIVITENDDKLEFILTSHWRDCRRSAENSHIANGISMSKKNFLWAEIKKISFFFSFVFQQPVIIIIDVVLKFFEFEFEFFSIFTIPICWRTRQQPTRPDYIDRLHLDLFFVSLISRYLNWKCANEEEGKSILLTKTSI